MTFSHPLTAVTAHAATTETTETTGFRNETAYGSLFLEPDLPVGTDDSDVSDFDEPEYIEPTREVSNRPRRNHNGRGDARRSNRRRTAA